MNKHTGHLQVGHVGKIERGGQAERTISHEEPPITVLKASPNPARVRQVPFTSGPETGAVDPDRCFGSNDPLLAEYHDIEWGVPVHDEAALLEMVVLLGFQAGLNWLQILRKRPALRWAFNDFEPYAVAAMTESDLHQLARRPELIRNPVKLAAAQNNALAVVRLHEEGTSLDELLGMHAPPTRSHAPEHWSDVPSQTTESVALARTLKSRGFKFVGPVSCYALMQSCGVVNDHLSKCPTTA